MLGRRALKTVLYVLDDGRLICAESKRGKSRITVAINDGQRAGSHASLLGPPPLPVPRTHLADLRERGGLHKPLHVLHVAVGGGDLGRLDDLQLGGTAGEGGRGRSAPRAPKKAVDSPRRARGARAHRPTTRPSPHRTRWRDAMSL